MPDGIAGNVGCGVPMRPLWLPLMCLAAPVFTAAQVPQNPSPMTDTTRPHPRVVESHAAGKRLTLPLGELFLSDKFSPRDQVPLVVHFHGDQWLIEQHVVRAAPGAALITVNFGAGSSRYAAPFADASRFRALMDEAAAGVATLTGQRPVWSTVTLTSFSAGYGAVRAILKVPENTALVNTVFLADSLHASYLTEGSPAAPRVADLPIDEEGFDVFVAFANDAIANRRRFFVTHSEVYPGTYASTTETATLLLSSVKVDRKPVLLRGPLGMQQLSLAKSGGFAVAGFAGNSAQDHLDHLYALGDWWRDWNVIR